MGLAFVEEVTDGVWFLVTHKEKFITEQEAQCISKTFRLLDG